jgi:cytochrome P450
MERFDGEAEAGAVDIYGAMVHFTLSLVGKSIFGRDLKDAELAQVGDAISTIQAFIVRQIVQPYKIPWFRISGESRRHQKMRVEADQILRRYVETRRREGGDHHDLLQMMLDTPYKDAGEPMSDDQVLIESLQLMVAGNETSSNALAWTFYLLARHPDCRDRIHGEVCDVFADGPIDYGGLHRLSFTVQVLDEAMRLYPPFWMIDRIAKRSDNIQGVHIPAGVTVIPYIYGAHRNLGSWEDPETFDPGRFAPERRSGRHPFAHIPFGGGPRVCIGSNMAIMQMLLVLVSFVRRYDFRMASEASVAIDPMMILRPGGAINLCFERR